MIPSTLSILHGSLLALISSASSRSMKSTDTPNSVAMDCNLTVLQDYRNCEQITTLVSRMKYLRCSCKKGSLRTSSMMLTKALKKSLYRHWQKDSRYSFISGNFIKQTIAYEESMIFFLRLTRSMFRMPVSTLYVTNFSQLMIQGQLKVGMTSTNNLLAAWKSRTISRQIPSQTLSLFLRYQSPPFSSSLQHSSIFSLILWLRCCLRQIEMSLKAMSIFLPISMVFLRARLQVAMASSSLWWSWQSSALARRASRTSVYPKFYSASLILRSFSARSSSKVFSISIFKLFLNYRYYHHQIGHSKSPHQIGHSNQPHQLGKWRIGRSCTWGIWF